MKHKDALILRLASNILPTPPLHPTQAPSDSRTAINSGSSPCHSHGPSFTPLEKKAEARGVNDQFSGQILEYWLLFCFSHILKNVPGNPQVFHPTNLVPAANKSPRVWRGHHSQRLLRTAGQSFPGTPGTPGTPDSQGTDTGGALQSLAHRISASFHFTFLGHWDTYMAFIKFQEYLQQILLFAKFSYLTLWTSHFVFLFLFNILAKTGKFNYNSSTAWIPREAPWRQQRFGLQWLDFW